MAVVEHLVAPGPSLELHDVYRLHPRALAGRISRIDTLNVH